MKYIQLLLTSLGMARLPDWIVNSIVIVEKVAHNQSDAQDIHNKHCGQGLYLAETSDCSERQYLYSENTVCTVRISIFGDNLWI